MSGRKPIDVARQRARMPAETLYLLAVEESAGGKMPAGRLGPMSRYLGARAIPRGRASA